MGMYHGATPDQPRGGAGDRTQVTLNYDWSEVPDALRERIGFPLFDQHHLDNSLQHLACLAAHR